MTTKTFEQEYMKECPKKRCKRYGIVIITDYRFCPECTTKLTAVYPAQLNGRQPIISGWDGDPKPTGKNGELIQLTTNPAANGAAQPTQPLDAGDKWVERRHYTLWNDDKKKWICWCGVECDQGGGKAAEHDNLPHARVLLSTLKDGDTYFDPDDSPKPTPASGNNMPKNDTFTCDPDVEGCPIIKDMRPRIEVPYEMFNKWVWLAKTNKCEWLAYLIGETLPIAENAPMGGWKITDMYFPRQRVTPSHVSVNDEDLRNLRPGVCGDVHSHVYMSAFFSGEDKRHFNHDVHLVVNAKSEIDSSIRHQLECGRTARKQGHVILVNRSDEVGDALKAVMEEEPAPIVTTSYGGGATKTIGRGHSYQNHNRDIWENSGYNSDT